MPRIVDYPLTLKATSLVMHRGPMDRASGQTTAVDGTEQGYSAVGDLLGIEITLPPARGGEARRQRGLITAMQQGGNAVKINLYDPDRLTKSDLGLVDTPQTWSNGLPWSSGAGWDSGLPAVAIQTASAKDTSIVYLSSSQWGHSLGLGDWVGFFPFHFGAYMVTEVIAAGTYRVWPRLRKALATTSYATLYPVVVMRLSGLDGGHWERGLWTNENVSMRLVEVPDALVRSDFV